MYTLNFSSEHMQVLWQALGELPAKLSMPVLDEIRKQVDAQNAAKTSPAPEPVPETIDPATT